MIFTAHLDEADTHGPAPTVILAGFLGHAYQWRRFETKLGRLQKRDGFSIFHAKEIKPGARVKGSTSEFATWSDDKCHRLINDLTDLVQQNLTDGFAVALERGRYLMEYRAPPIPHKMHIDSQLGVCFRACMSHLLDFMEARGNRDKLNIVMERGHENVWDCERIFNDIKRRAKRVGVDILGDFTVAAKDDCAPLMVADLLAATYSLMRDARARGVPEEAIVARPREKGEAGLTFLELLPDALRNLKTNFEKLRVEDIERWRAMKAARKVAS